MGRDEDDLAYLRDERVLQLPAGGAAQRRFRGDDCSSAVLLHIPACAVPKLDASADDTLRAVAAKATKEVVYHRDHATQWTLRLGDGTEESQRRMQRGLERMWPYTYELFEQDETNNRLVAQGIAVDPGPLRPEWERYVHAVLDEATLTMPEESSWRPTGGRQGLQRGVGTPAGRDAESAPSTPRSEVVSKTGTRANPGAASAPAGDDEVRRLRSIAARVPDPEIPVLSIEDLGVLREVAVNESGHVTVNLTPTYLAVPPWTRFPRTFAARLAKKGFIDVSVNLVLSPPWSTDMITLRGRQALHDFGIARQVRAFRMARCS